MNVHMNRKQGQNSVEEGYRDLRESDLKISNSVYISLFAHKQVYYFLSCAHILGCKSPIGQCRIYMDHGKDRNL